MPEGAEGCAENEPSSDTTTSLYEGPAVTTRIEAARQGPNEPTESQPSEKEYRIQHDSAGAEANLDLVAGAGPDYKSLLPMWTHDRQLKMQIQSDSPPPRPKAKPEVAQRYREEVHSAIGWEGPAMDREGELTRAAYAVALLTKGVILADQKNGIFATKIFSVTRGPCMSRWRMDPA